VAKNIGVAVARDHLGGDRLGLQAQLLADMFLDRRVDIGEGADRARDRAGGDLRRASRRRVRLRSISA
jgi:hypothetical protein